MAPGLSSRASRRCCSFSSCFRTFHSLLATPAAALSHSFPQSQSHRVSSSGFSLLPSIASLFGPRPASPADLCTFSAPSAARASSADASSAGGGASEGGREGPWLFVGLGNPGPKYAGTRHNVGFDILDALARAHGIPLGAAQCRALVGKGHIGGVPVILAKPQTFMNLSGDSVGPLAKFYKIPPSRVLPIYDDMDLDVASMKLLAKGGHGGHNGMRSIIERFGGDKCFPRLRFGIGRPPGKMDTKAFVLQRFDKSEKIEVEIAMERALLALAMICEQGVDRTVSQWNQPRKVTA